MLTETQRGLLIKDIKTNVDFSYDEDYDPNPQIVRYFEGHDWTNPQILVDFLPASRVKFFSISNMIAPATPLGQYHSFAHIQMEQCVIRCYAGKHQNNRNLNGRLLVESMAQKLRKHILRKWDSLLFDMCASIEKYEDMPLRDVSIFDRSRGTMVYIYELSFYIRTLFSWNNIPDDYDEEIGEDIVERIQLLEGNEELIGINIE